MSNLFRRFVDNAFSVEHIVERTCQRTAVFPRKVASDKRGFDMALEHLASSSSDAEDD